MSTVDKLILFCGAQLVVLVLLFAITAINMICGWGIQPENWWELVGCFMGSYVLALIIALLGGILK